MSERNLSIYYAHPVDLYNTPQEIRDLDLIDNLFGDNYKVINPNSPKDEDAYKAQGMEYFLNIVSGTNLLIFRGYPTGKIPAGVYKEIVRAIECGIPVLELPGLVDRVLSVEDTRQFMREIGTR